MGGADLFPKIFVARTSTTKLGKGKTKTKLGTGKNEEHMRVNDCSVEVKAMRWIHALTLSPNLVLVRMHLTTSTALF